jgi:predicted tellurium resistance membrane protein TerC
LFFTIFYKLFDLASLVLLAGGPFLIYKTVIKIHHKLEGEEDSYQNGNKLTLTMGKAVAQIMLIDMVFSFDSIITAAVTADYVDILMVPVK